MRREINILLILTLLLSISCNRKQKQIDTWNSRVKEFEKEKVLEEKDLGKTKKLIHFLENPIDLQTYKRTKGKSLSSVSGGADYHYNPKIKDSIFYEYSGFPADKNWSEIEPVNFLVFKYGAKKHIWKDSTEILIEFFVNGQDKDLKKANLVGLTKQNLESEFGNDYEVWGDQLIYVNNNKVLVIGMDNSKVKSFRYVKLNTEKIDSVLIQRLRNKNVLQQNL